MSGRCAECGEATVWDQELGSAICTHCGTLADPTQSVLNSHLEFYDGFLRETPWTDISKSTLKGRNGWALPGQGKEARDRQNTIAMHEYIKSVAGRLVSPGSAPRAQGIFDQAMRRGHYRWGRKARLVAGASVAIALREAHKSESCSDIAYFLEETTSSVSRTFTSVVSLLQLSLTSADPTIHLTALQTHLLSLLRDTPSALSAKLISTLTPLIPALSTVLRTASSLSALLARQNVLSHLPTPPTACALFILALEAESGSSLPQTGSLAQVLGARFGVGKGVIMQRYKIIYDLVEKWIRDIPWLEGHERKKGGAGRSKVAKRVVVARGLKDVVQFQEEIWREKMEKEARPHVHLEEEEEDTDGEPDHDYFLNGREIVPGTSNVSLCAQKEDVISGRPRKKRKTAHERSVTEVSRFLLNPASSMVSSSSRSMHGSGDDTGLLTHILTADTSDLSRAFAYAPTRLQLLAACRGGAEEKDIADEELFIEGELEAMLRSPEEVDIVRTAMDWDTGLAAQAESPGADRIKGKRPREMEGDASAMKGKSTTGGSKRIDTNALARLLDPSTFIDESGDIISEPIDRSALSVDDEEIVEEWRPASPGGDGFDEDRYEL
ncbi:uncharacterized protein LAESUDRAFT_755282 [Laetiporus sulphureus 93-53]|uniref:TFIIB-type domain-containing protein n=1 Tax=Laetiporus sulphureus 93-53 TaxID=1314785 RepID=A0A165HEX7_9APHY|nr:uncharacterized protein LAESUDRAFT_755282 [Laetiporus sulphureus 93-53]KZT11649.1 hypothetical protein LAESUDRAFT_755282 [Laetiporus sulphureus 93-53]